MEEFVLDCPHGTLRCDEKGRVTGLRHNGVETAARAENAFLLGFRDPRRDLVILTDADFSACRVEAEEKRLRFSYTGNDRNLEAGIEILSTAAGFEFYSEVRNIPDDFPLEWVDAPSVCVRKAGLLLWPRCEGVLIDGSDRREEYGPWHTAGFVDTFPGGFYPGHCQMQFLCHWDDSGEGLYFEAADRTHTLKNVDFAPAGNNRRLSLQTFCGGRVEGGVYRSPFACLLRGFSGDWRDGCAIYRDRIESDPVLPEKGNYHPLMRRSPVVVIYPVQGEGKDCGAMGPNEYYPYTRALPVLEELSKKLESPVMSLLMHWEGTAPWAPPYVWPPLGGEALLGEFRDKLHEKGNYLGLYASGTAWTQTSSINDYSCERQFEEEHLVTEMIRGPHGEIKAVSCNGPKAQRIGYDMCMARKWCRETVKKEISKISAFGADYIQFFDQNIGGRFLPCYAPDHGHPELPGVWQTEAMKSLYRETVAETGALLGSEAAAALPYIKELPFSDLRDNFDWPYGEPVPAYAFVFHEYTVNFSGNQCGLNYHLDLEGAPVNMLYRIAYGFSAGDLLSAVLKDKGRIHWGWGVPWSVPEPGQEDVISLIANLNRVRREHPEFLLEGRMEKPCAKIECGNTFILRKNGEKIVIPEVLSCQWRSPAGKRALVLTNYQPHKTEVAVDGRGIVLEPLNAAVIEI